MTVGFHNLDDIDPISHAGVTRLVRSKADADASNGREERAAVTHAGLLVPVERDRLEIAQALAAAPTFPVDTLPPLLRQAVAALEEHVQAPQALCAHSILSAAALCTQGLANVQVASLPTAKPISLFMLVVAASGERKSACDDIALHAIGQMERDDFDDYREADRWFKAKKAAADAERRKIETDKNLDQHEREQRLLGIEEPTEPLVPFLRAKEPNLEGLINFLGHSRASVGVFTSEGGQFLGGHGMSDEARTRTITGLTELWDSGSAQRIRAKEITNIEGRRVSISLAAQPKIAATLLGDDLARDQGFVARFLVTMPDSTIGSRKIRPSNPLADSRLQAFHGRCRLLLETALPLREGTQNVVDPPAIGLDHTAWKIWQRAAQGIEDQCGPEGQWFPVRASALKMAEHIARIAAVLTLFEHPSATVITGDAMATATEIGWFYLQEAARLCGHAILDPETRAQNELAEWMTLKWEHPLISPTHIQQYAPGHLRAGSAVTRTRLTALCAAGVLELNGKGAVGGKSFRETYRIARSLSVAA